MSDTKTKSKIDSTNIFEDFTSDTKLWKEVKAQEEKQSKDAFHYIKLSTEFLKILNLIFILWICIFSAYSFFQSRDTLENYSLFEPICGLFLWEVADNVSGCYWLTAFTDKLKADANSLKQEQFDEVAPLFEHVYELDNFTNSKSITFLLEKTDTRLQPLTILSDFDELKNKFEPIDKSKVQCFDIVIRDDMTLSARCEAYSSDWDSDISTIENDKKSWTSISVASSFIDFIENSETSNFNLINKQKVFDYTNVSWNGIYTKKTDFDIDLQYNDTNNLAL